MTTEVDPDSWNHPDRLRRSLPYLKYFYDPQVDPQTRLRWIEFVKAQLRGKPDSMWRL